MAGPGIKAADIAKIFDPFFMTKPVVKGTGLGLSPEEISKVSVPNRGNSRPPMATLPISGVGRSILVIDDEEWILSLTEQLLRREGYSVVAVPSCEKALAILTTQTFDVIVSDWKMPGLNGIQLYEHLKAKAPESAARMLFMTGDVMSDTFEQFLMRNGKTCLPEPFAIQDFRLGGMLGAK